IARALQKLRAMMLKAAPTLGIVAVPQWLEAHALVTAPAHLSVAATGAALAGASATASAIAKASASAMLWFKAQLAVAASIAVLACGAGAVLLTQQATSTPS